MWTMGCSFPTPILVCLSDSSFFPNIYSQYKGHSDPFEMKIKAHDTST